jgi:pimeloyl-ACP methyl ester carboxylesterase/class 3 adenylate cyclase
MVPETKYTHSGDVSIAYQIVGEGAIDIVLVPGWVSNIDVFWEEPTCARFLQRLASFCRLILFDKRGTGLSDRVTATPTLEERMDDVRAVMDAVGSERAALLGYSEGGPMCALFAATYPERTASLIMIGSYARRLSAPDYPWGIEPAEREEYIESVKREWGGPVALARRAPSMATDARFSQWWARLLRMGASPATAVALTRMNSEIDVRPILPSVKVPTLVIHAQNDKTVNVESGRHLARNIPEARFVELPTADHLPWVGCPDQILDEVEQFLTGIRTRSYHDRVLCTVMFTDLVGSTEIALRLGDQRWRDLLEAHHQAVRRELSVFRGREVDTAGDGFYATFGGPARAIHCARMIRDSVKSLGLSIRIGVHTGECEIKEEELTGIAIHIGARIAALATANQIVVSQTVKDLVAGSGIEFEDNGVHALKGIAEEWHLYVVQSSGAGNTGAKHPGEHQNP